ncbi:intracellular short-chain-length polyhydroxyalkanoate depolymerase [Evansella halocellulosilytica]|uniref:intracellular short-chain-length polyhydroxyalkanoate depolymerase n=1 Tax=Evansella halocellulosilytica TaxID=2011013 RepID=UPI0027B8DCE7|nr:alpha/beta hydrolase [Evansella halocellulosilytica]
MKVHVKTIELENGEMLGYREREGGCEVLVFIHGNMQSSKHWDVLLETIDSRYKVYAVDLRGCGLSSYNKPFDSLKELAVEVKQFIDQLNLPSVSVIGWSTGGGVAMNLAAMYPERIKNLILLASLSTRGYPLFKVDEQGNPRLSERLKTKDDIKTDTARYIPISNAYETKNKEVLKMIWNTLIYTHNQPEEKQYEAYLEDMLTQQNLLDVYYANNRFNISHHHNGLVDGTGEIDEIQCPALILWGENDLVVTEQMTEELKNDFGDKAEFVLLKNCGHSPLIDDLGQLRTAITSFLQKNV